MKKETFKLRPTDEFIQLIKLLKLKNIANSGGQAKLFVEDKMVKVNGEIELRKTKKLRAGDIIEIENFKIEIIT